MGSAQHIVGNIVAEAIGLVAVVTGAAYTTAVELDLQNVRDVIRRQFSHLSSVRVHDESQRLRDASWMGTVCDSTSQEAYRDNSASIVTYMAGTFERLEHDLRHVLLVSQIHRTFPSGSTSVGRYRGKTGKIPESSPNTFALVEQTSWFHCGGCQRSELLGRALADHLEHGGTTRHDVGAQVLADVNVALHDAQQKTCRRFRWLS